ncbi:MAG: isocitrate/isopropylmalate family dehydrogenase, partial [Gemmatimonadales bacterium]
FAPGANLGTDAAIFEAVHGSAPDIAGLGIANHSALTLAACLMLDHVGESARADRIRTALAETLREGTVLTSDLGGDASTEQFASAVIERL